MELSDWISLGALVLALFSFIFSKINKHKQKYFETNQDKLIKLKVQFGK